MTYELKGLYHLYPTGIMETSSIKSCNSGCPAGYEYESLVSWDGSENHIIDFRVNANSFVKENGQIALAQMSGSVINGVFRMDQSRLMNGSSGWGNWHSDIAVAKRMSQNKGIFNYHYEGSEYPYEYGIMGWKYGGGDYARLWEYNSTYCMSVMREGSITAFLRGWVEDGECQFDKANGHYSGDWFYADAVYTLFRDGNFHQVMIEGCPLKWKFNIVTGEFVEWWTGSENNPNNSYTFSLCSGNTVHSIPLYTLHNCQIPFDENYCAACNNCQP